MIDGTIFRPSTLHRSRFDLPSHRKTYMDYSSRLGFHLEERSGDRVGFVVDRDGQALTE